jgi:tight adherence protein B
MLLIAISCAVFLLTLGLLTSAAYFLIQAPAARQQLRVRLAAIQQTAVVDPEAEIRLIRENALGSIPFVQRVLLRIRLVARLQLFMDQAGVALPLVTMLFISASAALAFLLIALVGRMPVPLALLLGGAGGASPFLFIAYKRRMRFSAFEEQFPDAIDMLARAVRAGHAFTTGFSLIASEMPQPAAGEFKMTFEQQNLGLPMGDALQNFEVRMPLQDVKIFVAALAIQRESGGNLGEILDKLSMVIRERFKILRQAEVFTAEGRMSLYILTAMPPAAAVLMYVVNPEYMGRLFTESLGHVALAAAAFLQVTGYLVIRRIVRIKV